MQKLSDAEYLSVLHRIVEVVNSKSFLPIRSETEGSGDRGISSNCGLCSSRFVTQQNAMFPAEFPEHRKLAQRHPHQRCPFDTRDVLPKIDFSTGCYFHCVLFKTKQEYLTRLVPRLVLMAEYTFSKVREAANAVYKS